MINHGNLLRYTCLVLAVLTIITVTGCCGRARKKPAKIDKKSLVVGETTEETAETTDESSHKPRATRIKSPGLNDKEKVTEALYQRLENAFDMFQKDNIDGAHRELERVQLEINDDPYLEMQTWYLSAMIYHKSGKTSRRKRSMRKMLESMEQLQKDPRFRRSFEDGMVSQEVIKMAIEKGEGQYAE